MNPPPARDPTEAMAALERLFARNVVTLEQAKVAARLITGDPAATFPPPPPPQAPPEEAEATPEGTPPSPPSGNGPSPA